MGRRNRERIARVKTDTEPMIHQTKDTTIDQSQCIRCGLIVPTYYRTEHDKDCTKDHRYGRVTS